MAIASRFRKPRLFITKTANLQRELLHSRGFRTT
jgi:hypothetical protein